MKETDTFGSRASEIRARLEESRAENDTAATQTTEQGAATAAPRNEWGERLSRYRGTRERSCPDCGHSEADLWLSEGAVSHALRCRICQTTFTEEESR